ncbi:uncharacterized protein LOC129219333 [Uloborus diversus]|uniref:uncharacterized protein LOC129219333 n=1 Tax=Uloborus diversus TaxID=327109 RepID=UPI00240A365A|nr:uncharacterized protein LOC129219333 [Uloborus diversus]
MDSKGNDALIKTTKVTEWTINHGGYLSLLFGGFILFGCALAYIIAVSRGNVDPFLPLISDAAGSPPQNGLFGTFVCLGGMFGVAFMVQRYMIVLEINREKSSLVTLVNKLSLVVGVLSMIGITLVTGYPVNFYRNRDIWLMDVGLPHMIGGVMLFALGLLYIAFQCVLTLFLRTKGDSTLFIRVVILFICTAAFVYHMITVPENFGGISHKYYINSTESVLNDTTLLPYPPTMGASLKLPIDTSGTYVKSALSEWILVFFFCCFFFTFYHEAEQFSMQIIIETHSTKETELADEPKIDIRKLSLAQIQNGSQIDGKPAPEVRKFLRRDSTCQTMSDGVETMTITPKDVKNGGKPKKKAATDFGNGTKKHVANVEVDTNLSKLLEDLKNDEDAAKDLKDQVTTTEKKTSMESSESSKKKGDKVDIKSDADKEAERIAIEKIDVVVKDAEERVGKEATTQSNHEGSEANEKSSSDDK